MALKNLFGDIGLDSTLTEIKNLLIAIMKPLTQVTGAGSNRLSVDVNNLVGGTVTTVTTVTNQTNIGGVSAFELQKATSHNAFANAIRPSLN
jgi:hypothetical protein